MTNTRLKSQLEETGHYVQMQRCGEDDPSYRTSYLHDVGPEDDPVYTITVDVFDDAEGGCRLVPFMDVVASNGEFHHIEIGPVDDLQTLEELFLSAWRAIQLGSTLYPV